MHIAHSCPMIRPNTERSRSYLPIFGFLHLSVNFNNTNLNSHWFTIYLYVCVYASVCICIYAYMCVCMFLTKSFVCLDDKTYP